MRASDPRPTQELRETVSRELKIGQDCRKSGRPQKKLFLDDEGKKGVARLYCKIRGM